MRVRIINDDGKGYLTKVLNAETGEEIHGVVAVTIDHLTVTNEPIKITLELHPLSLDIVGVASFVKLCPFCGETIKQEREEVDDTTTDATVTTDEDTDGSADQVE